MPDITYEETKRAIAMVAMLRLQNNCAEESLWQKATYTYQVYKQTDKHNCHFPKYFEKLEHTRLKVFTASETFEPLGLLPKIKKLSC